MAVSGIMLQIRDRLAQGASAQELISEGYKQGSVRKVRWQMDKRGELESATSTTYRPLPCL